MYNLLIVERLRSFITRVYLVFLGDFDYDEDDDDDDDDETDRRRSWSAESRRESGDRAAGTNSCATARWVAGEGEFIKDAEPNVRVRQCFGSCAPVR